MDNLICKLCAGSPDIDLYKICLSESQRQELNKDVVYTDICIGKEIKMLIENGVITYGCCCGHGESLPSGLVDVCSKDILITLGYNLIEYSKEHSNIGIYNIILKSNIQKELRKALKNKIFRYVE